MYSRNLYAPHLMCAEPYCLSISSRPLKVCLERTQEDLLDDMHQRIRQSKVDGGLGVKKGEQCIGVCLEAVGW